MTHARERSLTLLVIVEAIQLFVVVPLSAEAGVTFAVFVAIVVANIAVALAVVWHLRVAVVAVVVASAIEAVAVAVRIVQPSHGTALLDAAAALVLLVTLTVVLSLVVFGPGRVTVHRILGAVAIYLNVAAAFGVAYRMIDALGPGRFSALHDGHTLADLVYFSFTTLTTTGFGDILPIDPFARSLSNLESVIGQLFPATLLARLITLEIEHRRDLPD